MESGVAMRVVMQRAQVKSACDPDEEDKEAGL